MSYVVQLPLESFSNGTINLSFLFLVVLVIFVSVFSIGVKKRFNKFTLTLLCSIKINNLISVNMDIFKFCLCIHKLAGFLRFLCHRMYSGNNWTNGWMFFFFLTYLWLVPPEGHNTVDYTVLQYIRLILNPTASQLVFLAIYLEPNVFRLALNPVPS